MRPVTKWDRDRAAAQKAYRTDPRYRSARWRLKPCVLESPHWWRAARQRANTHNKRWKRWLKGGAKGPGPRVLLPHWLGQFLPTKVSMRPSDRRRRCTD